MIELGEQKLDHSEFENFKDFYTYNWQKFIDYNIHDVELVDRMEDKMRLIELCLTMAYDARQNYEDVYSQVKTWDNIIFNFLRKDNIVVPQKTNHKKDSLRGVMSRNRFWKVIGWLVLTLTVFIPILLCSTTSPPRPYKILDTIQQPSIRY